MNDPIPFPAAGEGVTVAFSVSDLIELQTALHSPERIVRGMADVLAALSHMDLETTKAALAVGLKNPDGTRWTGDLDAIDFAIADAVDATGDAISKKMFGKRASVAVTEGLRQ